MDSKKNKTDWLNTKWRPMMAWMYMVVCIMDFVIFPVLWSAIQVSYSGQIQAQWNPITLQGAGLFHMAMGAVLGVTAWGRSREKMMGGPSMYDQRTPYDSTGYDENRYPPVTPQPAPRVGVPKVYPRGE